LEGYLTSGRTVTTLIGAGRGSPLEKWIVAKAIKALTTRAKMAARRIGSILSPLHGHERVHEDASCPPDLVCGGFFHRHL
jgi:hypothetical protein